MPLYLVRWPNLSVSLISAKNENDLLHTIDEIGDPSGCTWKVYKGPIHLDFRLKIDFVDKSNYKGVPFKPSATITPHGKTFEIHDYEFEKNDSETITAMWDAVTKTAFPNLWKYYEKRFSSTPTEGKPSKAEFEAAVLADLREFYELEFVQRSPESQKPFDRN